MNKNKSPEEIYIGTVSKLIHTIVFLLIVIMVLIIILIFNNDIEKYMADAPKRKAAKIAMQSSLDSLKRIYAIEDALENEYNTFWKAKSIESVSDNTLKTQLRYGQDLIAHTAKYFGPKGSIQKISNGMNCQNCHLQAGTLPWGNNYGSVFSTYPKYRARSGTIENIYKRINDCFERSLNGMAIDTSSKEMQAMKSYIEFIGSDVKKGEKAKGSGIYELTYLNRACNPDIGKTLYDKKCASCHQPDGQGQLALDGIEYSYPPLWGKHSYNSGAGLFRLSRLAGYIFCNMPQGTTFKNPQLTEEEAWDLAAFINSQPRPVKDLSKDWPKINEKPADHPFGPYADSFTEEQHKYGPYQDIVAEQKKQMKLK